ncbi:rCG57542 [Rattus norvegicus]|uniref:RCG57542 n=1 Tax=Rattus norvegicus TaxID=10116 RepID=A6JH65_RAT|nr:rCG57542 [Rattus norvegicus]
MPVAMPEYLQQPPGTSRLAWKTLESKSPTTIVKVRWHV